MDHYHKWSRAVISILLCFAVLLSCVHSVFASGVPALPPGSSSGSTVVVDIGSIKDFFIGIQEFWEAYSESREAFYEEKEAQAEAVSAWLDTADKAIGYLKEWFGSSETDDDDSDYDDFVSSLGGIRSVGFHLTSLERSTFDNWLSEGNLLLYTLDANTLDFTVGKYTAYSNSYGSYTYYFAPYSTAFYWDSDSFYIPSDGYYELSFPDFYFSRSSKVYFYIYRYVNDAWSLVDERNVFSTLSEDLVLDTHMVAGGTKTYMLAGGYDYKIQVMFPYNSLYSSVSGTYNGVSGFFHLGDVQISAVDSAGTVYDPSDPEQAADEKYSEETRMSTITQIFSDYNKYTDNSIVAHYYIGTLDESQNVTNCYDVNIFDEQSKVFTEPVTGAQYLATNWTYNYESRAYAIALEAGSMYIGDTEIPTIILQYGDDAVTIYYVDAAENIVQTDEYAYVMVASNECALNGHAYNVETTLEPSCTRVGERTYTCSVCGDQYVENIPLLEHTYTFTIIREPSCSSPGMGTYACSACGMQYTESIPALEHTGVLLEVVDTVYGESGAVITAGYSVYECSTCGTHYIEYDDVGTGTGSGFWSSLVDSFTNALSSVIDAILGLIIYVLETLLSLIKDLLSFLYSFITDTVLGGISNMFAAFTDGSLWEFFQTEDGTVGLPGDVSIVFTFFSGVIMALPWEIRTALFFAIAAGVLIAIFKLS